MVIGPSVGEAQAADKLLLSYPFISLSKGTGLPLVHHGQRVCVPQQGQAKSC